MFLSGTIPAFARHEDKKAPAPNESAYEHASDMAKFKRVEGADKEARKTKMEAEREARKAEKQAEKEARKAEKETQKAEKAANKEARRAGKEARKADKAVKKGFGKGLGKR